MGKQCRVHVQRFCVVRASLRQSQTSASVPPTRTVRAEECGGIRRAIGSDVAEVQILIFNSGFGWSSQSVQDAICGETYRSLVTVERGSLAGVLVSQVVADEVQMMMLATAESFRRRGVATALIQSLMQACGSTHQYLLEVSDTNAPALDLYQKLGFEVYGTRRKYYADGNDAILLMLPACSSSGLDDI